MNIKILLSTCFGFYASVAAATQPIGGGYIGVLMGSQACVDTYKGEDQVAQQTVNAAVGLFAGFGYKTSGNIYLGAELGVDFPLGGKASLSFKNIKDYPGVQVAVGYKKGITARLAPRLGYVFNDVNLLYSTFGVGISNDKATGKITNGVNTESDFKQKTVYSFNPGFGFEHRIDKMSFGLEYTYQIGSKVKSDDDDGYAQRKSHNVSLRISFCF